jgi:hypothetical protein
VTEGQYPLHIPEPVRTDIIHNIWTCLCDEHGQTHNSDFRLIAMGCPWCLTEALAARLNRTTP